MNNPTVVVGISENFLAGLPSRLRGVPVVEGLAQSRHRVWAVFPVVLSHYMAKKVQEFDFLMLRYSKITLENMRVGSRP